MALAQHEERLLELRARVAELEARLQRDTGEYVEAVRDEYMGYVSKQLSDIARSSAAAVATLQAECVGAVLDVAEVVCRRHFADNETLVREQIRRQLRERGSFPLKVKVGPSGDFERQDDPLFDLSVELHGETSVVQVEVSEELEAGDIVIAYADGTLDFTLSTVLETLRPVLERHIQSLRVRSATELVQPEAGLPGERAGD
jgi:flagellar biosynthesis/type III secretory pathway protein FliH